MNHGDIKKNVLWCNKRITLKLVSLLKRAVSLLLGVFIDSYMYIPYFYIHTNLMTETDMVVCLDFVIAEARLSNY